MAEPLLVDQDFFIIEASRSDSDTPHSVGLLWTSDQPDAKTTHNTHKGHTPGGIRTRIPSKRTAAGPELRPRGHCDRQRKIHKILFSSV